MNKSFDRRDSAGREESPLIEEESDREMKEAEIRLEELKKRARSGSKEERIGAIRAASKDEYWRIRGQALVMSVKILSEKERLEAVKSALQDIDWRVREIALENAKILPKKERLEVLRIALKDKDWLIRELALITGVKILSGEERLEIIQIALKDEDPKISNRAEQYLRFYYPKEYEKYMQEKQKLQESK